MQIKLKKDDFYLVYNDYFYFNFFEKELNLLYLPLVGSVSIRLYQFLFNKIIVENNVSDKYLYYDLIDNLNINLQNIEIARKKLEAIGLLETYYLENNNKNIYIFKIKKPLSFEEFFNNPFFSKILENTIGNKEYKKIFNVYSTNKMNFSNLVNITTKFTDFYSYESLDYDYSLDNLVKKYKGPNLDDYYFDIDKLKFLLNSKYILDVLNDENVVKNVISLAYMYQSDPLEMANAIEKSVNLSEEDYYINFEKLHNYFIQLNTVVKKQQLPTLDNMLNKKCLEEIDDTNKVLSVEEKFAKILDNTNYIKFLNKRYSIIISNVDAKKIVELRDKYDLNTGVLNVLLDYSIKKSSSNNLPHINYLDKIASSWSNKRLISAIDAMLFIKENESNKKEIKKVAKKTEVSNYNKVSKKYVVSSPDYIKEQFKNINSNNQNSVQTAEDLKEHNELMEILEKEGIN